MAVTVRVRAWWGRGSWWEIAVLCLVLMVALDSNKFLLTSFSQWYPPFAKKVYRSLARNSVQKW